MAGVVGALEDVQSLGSLASEAIERRMVGNSEAERELEVLELTLRRILDELLTKIPGTPYTAANGKRTLPRRQADGG